ncbi:Nucleotide-binding universal stress protein, UspA family [Marinobacter antarcticus]|uniref:Nucleotide-binding universal stress protein, UspA family n=1 Tax=Marinobacter antarcticus TaxID=564117 RepID=A0A1M6PFA0_9GAMM|nr:universal stress protein [Marinobacter antarcticus]SHK06577.1 Nucleotide-binding universal stress protein, UspA family [Marinobacter antarcticus]
MFHDVKKILYVSDLDQGSRPAFRAAVSLCGHYSGAQITYLYVIESLSSTARSLLSNMMEEKELEDMLHKGVEELSLKIRGRIERFCAEELEEHEVLGLKNIEARIEEGTPWRKILEVGDEMNADVIVMGTRKHSALGQALMGSTATKTLTHSKRPVLIVPLGVG